MTPQKKSLKKAPWSKHGWGQRTSTLLLLPFIFWGVGSTFHLFFTQSFEAIQSKFGGSLVGVVALLFTLLALCHGYLGLKVVFEDYMPSPQRDFWIHSVRLFFIAGALVAGSALLKLWVHQNG